MIFPNMFNKGSHLLQDTFLILVILLGKKKYLVEEKNYFSKNSRFIEIKNKYYSDINTLEDLK